jgi:hypothetical protein
MGWCRGSYMAEDMWNKVRKYIPKEEKKSLANEIYEYFCDQDADCWESDMKLIKDAKIKWD